MTDYPSHVRTKRAVTARRRQILRFIARYSAERGAPPSIREISEATRVNISCVHGHLAWLAECGLIARPPRLARAVFVTDAGRAALAAGDAA